MSETDTITQWVERLGMRIKPHKARYSIKYDMVRYDKTLQNTEVLVITNLRWAEIPAYLAGYEDGRESLRS